jgi:hypothetical protein
MLKKLMLSAAFALFSLTNAQINLELDLTVSADEEQIHRALTIVAQENEVNTVSFDELNGLIVNIIPEVTEEKVVIQTQFAQKVNEDLVPVTEWLPIEVAFDQVGRVTINEDNNTEILVLLITPSQIKETITQE